jgi:hypothetical protein
MALATCRRSASQRSSIVLRDDAVDAKDLLKWRLARGGAAAPEDFLDPVAGAPQLAVCVYDASASLQPLLVGTLFAGGTCDGRPCWKQLGGAGGYRYRNRAGTSAGLTRVKLRVSRSGALRLAVKAKGIHLPMTPLGLVTPVRVQLQVAGEDGTTCWESAFESASRNDATMFRAKGS